MAKTAADSGFWRGLAIGLMALVISMLGWFLVRQVDKTDAIEKDVSSIQRDIGIIKQRLGILEIGD